MTEKNSIYTEKLFSYGTLQYESVQLSTFSRKLTGQKDFIIGYKLTKIEITDPIVLAKSKETFHPMITYTGNPQDEVAGMVFDISQKELEHADEYEVKDYKRVLAKLKSGLSAWVYVNAN